MEDGSQRYRLPLAIVCVRPRRCKTTVLCVARCSDPGAFEAIEGVRSGRWRWSGLRAASTCKSDPGPRLPLPVPALKWLKRRRLTLPGRSCRKVIDTIDLDLASCGLQQNKAPVHHLFVRPKTRLGPTSQKENASSTDRLPMAWSFPACLACDGCATMVGPLFDAAWPYAPVIVRRAAMYHGRRPVEGQSDVSPYPTYTIDICCFSRIQFPMRIAQIRRAALLDPDTGRICSFRRRQSCLCLADRPALASYPLRRVDTSRKL